MNYARHSDNNYIKVFSDCLHEHSLTMNMQFPLFIDPVYQFWYTYYTFHVGYVKKLH